MNVGSTSRRLFVCGSEPGSATRAARTIDCTTGVAGLAAEWETTQTEQWDAVDGLV